MTTRDPKHIPEAEATPNSPRLVQSLGLFSSTAIVAGSMIGSGIFIVDADIARGTDSPALLLGAWVVTAILTMIGALSYGELAAMMPKAGGQYVYLRESLGPLWGFLYGWTLFLVIQTGTIAAVCVAFGKFLGIFFPSVSTAHWLWHIAHVPALKMGPMVLGNMEIGVNTANLTGIAVVVFLAIVNIFGVSLGALIQNIFTTAKVLSLAALILLAFIVGRNATAWEANFGPGWSQFWRNFSWREFDLDLKLIGTVFVAFLAIVIIFRARLGALIQWALTLAVLILLRFTVLALMFEGNAAYFGVERSSLHPMQVGAGGPIVLVNVAAILAVVQVGSLFSADAWNNITFTAGEVKNPRRNIPLSLILGVGFVLTVYLLASVAYLLVLPLHGDPNGSTVLARGIQYATEDRVATAALEQIFHSGGAQLMAAAILVSTFGCANGMTLAGARVYYAMSQDGLFFKSVGKLHPRYKTPVAGLLVQAAWTILLCVSGSYSQLLDYIIFAVLVFYILTVAGLFVLRFRRPDAPRPYRALGYPALPALYIAMAAWICIVLLRYKPQYTWPGLVLVLLGIPVYLFWSRHTAGRAQDV